jgi:hypothetical protein
LPGGDTPLTLKFGSLPAEEVRFVVKSWCPCLALLLLPASVSAQSAQNRPADPIAGAPLAHLIRTAILAKLPPVFEDRSGWGRTIPVPERVRFPRLRRTVMPVGDRMEVPDGPWRKVRLRVEQPDRDVRVHIRSFHRVEATTYRVVVETDVALRGEADVQRWRNGLELADLSAGADVGLAVIVECDMAGRLDTRRLPPRIVMEPKVRDVKLNLTEFTPRQVTFRRAGLTIAGGPVEALGDEVKGFIQDRLRALEPQVKERAGEALTRMIKEGDPRKAAAVLDAAAPLMREK